MRERLILLWRLLSNDNGVLLISINDDEIHYLKVMCDELFGRDKFIAKSCLNYEGNTDNQAKIINYHEYVLVYSKSGKIDDPSVIDPNIDPSSLSYLKVKYATPWLKMAPRTQLNQLYYQLGFLSNVESGVIYKPTFHGRSIVMTSISKIT